MQLTSRNEKNAEQCKEYIATQTKYSNASNVEQCKQRRVMQQTQFYNYKKCVNH